LLNDEFNLYRDLKPVKIWITGPPAVGKTYFSRKLVNEYNISHVNIPNLVEEFENLENDLGIYIK